MTGAKVTACSTCRFDGEAREDADGVRGGRHLVAALTALAAEEPHYAGIAVESVACLWACAEHCVVNLQAPGKVGYIAGRFAPDAEAARAILDFAVGYAASEDGGVPYRDWPEGVKGHFIARTPAG